MINIFTNIAKGLLVASLLLIGAQAEAVVLQPVNVPNVSIENPIIVADNISFVVRSNESGQDTTDLRYGIRLQGESGDLIKEDVLGTMVFPPLNNRKAVVEEFTPPSWLSEDASVFVIMKDSSGVVLTAAYAGEVSAVLENEQEEIPTLTMCELVSSAYAAFNCEAESVGADTELIYNLYEESSYGKVVYTGTVDSFESGKAFTLSNNISDGRYEVVFELIDSSGIVYPYQQKVVVTKPYVDEGLIGGESQDSDFSSIFYSVLTLMVLLIIIFAIYRITHRRLPTTMAVFMMLMFAPIAFVSAEAGGPGGGPAAPSGSSATFLSQDDTNIMFSVSLDKAAYLPDEDVSFTFGIVDRNTGSKPSNSSVTAHVGSNSATTLVSTSDTATFYHHSIDGASEEGTYDITFSSPDLCGSAFNYSLFNVARFGSDDCEFTVSVIVSDTAVNTEAPTVPLIAGVCIVGESNDFTFYSYDAQGSNVAYEIKWGDGAESRIPVSSGYVSSGVAQTASHSWSIEGSVSIQARAIDDDGNESAWGAVAVTCGDGSDDSEEYELGGAGCSAVGNFGISAAPSLVRQGDTSEISWIALRGLSSCTITGNGDSWSGLQGTETTSDIDETSVYTISCLSACSGDNIATTTTVNIAPNWQEE